MSALSKDVDASALLEPSEDPSSEEEDITRREANKGIAAGAVVFPNLDSIQIGPEWSEIRKYAAKEYLLEVAKGETDPFEEDIINRMTAWRDPEAVEIAQSSEIDTLSSGSSDNSQIPNQYGWDAGNTAYIPVRAPIDNMTQEWVFTPDSGNLNKTPTTDGKSIFATGQDTAISLDFEGNSNWNKGVNSFSTYPAAVGEKVATLGAGDVLGLNKNDKNEIYSKETPGSAGLVTRKNGLLAVQDSVKQIQIHDAETGKQKNSFESPSPNIRKSVAMEGGNTYWATDDGVLHGRDIENGDIVLEKDLGIEIDAGMSVLNGTIFNTGNGKLHATDIETGKTVSYEIGARDNTAPTLKMNADGAIEANVGTIDGDFFQLLYQDGKLVEDWKSSLASAFTGHSAIGSIVTGMDYNDGENAIAVALNKEDGTKEWEITGLGKPAQADPLFHGKRAYFVTGNSITAAEGDLEDLTVPHSIAGNDYTIGLTEIQTAIDYWAEGKEVPATGGETIGLSQIQELIDYWAEGKEIPADQRAF
jgi:hypothetical protein